MGKNLSKTLVSTQACGSFKKTRFSDQLDPDVFPQSSQDTHVEDVGLCSSMDSFKDQKHLHKKEVKYTTTTKKIHIFIT